MTREEWQAKCAMAQDELEDKLDGAVSPEEIRALAEQVTARLYGECPEPEAPTPRVRVDAKPSSPESSINLSIGGTIGNRVVLLDPQSPRVALSPDEMRDLFAAGQTCIDWIEEYGE